MHSPAGRSTAPSSVWPPPTVHSRAHVEAALDYAATARSHIASAPHRRELEALTFAVVDRAS